MRLAMRCSAQQHPCPMEQAPEPFLVVVVTPKFASGLGRHRSRFCLRSRRPKAPRLRGIGPRQHGITLRPTRRLADLLGLVPSAAVTREGSRGSDVRRPSRNRR